MLAVDIGAYPADPSGCVSCCCEVVSIKPGETLPLYLNYAPWAAPIALRGLHCVPSVEVEERQTCDTPAGSNLPPSAPPQIRFDAIVNTPLDGDLNTQVTDPDGDAMTFKAMAHYAPKHGSLKLKSDGTFTYTPVQNYKGEDRFYFSVTDNINPAVVMEAMIGVGISSWDVKGTWDLVVGPAIVNQRMYMVTLPISASPAAKTCQVFRLTIRQGALDCECNCYYHTDCVDVRIVKC